MAGFVTAAAAAFALVFVAEFADKTQLALVALSSRGRWLHVWLGAAAAFLVLSVLAVAVGGLVARAVPARLVAAASGLLFVAFGIMSLRDRGAEEAEAAREAGFWSTFALMLVAETGDKTQLTLAALAAAGQDPVATAMGGWLALSVAAGAAVALGGVLQRRVPARYVSLAAGLLFLAVGALLLARAAWPSF